MSSRMGVKLSHRGPGEHLLAHWVSIAIVGLLLAVLAACAQAQQARTPSLTDVGVGAGQTIVVGLAQAPVSLDPADHRDRLSETVIRNMFDGLVTRDTGNGVHLELAEELRWLDDRTLEIHLRRGVLFHDGEEMTAEDVVYTFNRIIGEDAIEYPQPHTSPRRSLLSPLEVIVPVDRYTVVMRFVTPWPLVEQMLVHQQIVPWHYIAQVGTQGFAAHPIGTGPFRFVSADANLNEIVLERFDGYYGGSPDLAPVGSACVERVIFRAIPDTLTRVAALRAGEVDIAQGIPAQLINLLTTEGDIRVESAPGTRPVWMEMNVSRLPFSDIRLRLAMNLAINRQTIIREVYGGQALPLAGPLSPDDSYADKGLRPYAYDPEQARALLVDAGYADPATDILYGRRGRVLAFTIDTMPEWELLAAAVAQQLVDIGVDARVRVWERRVLEPLLLAGRRTAVVSGWGDSAFDPAGNLEAKWHTYAEDEPYGRGNYSGYDNERVNELIVLGEITTDPTERKIIYDEAQRIIYEEVPAVFLVLPEQIEAASTAILNWEPASDGRINLHDVCKAW